MPDEIIWGNSLKNALESAGNENKLALISFSNPA